MSRTLRVLVVDDERVTATTLAMVLKGAGFDAVAAFSGSEALKLANASQFDILLSDVMMSPIDGIHVAKAFRNMNPASRIFLFTGTPEAAERMFAAYKAGYDFQVFAKPLNPAQIIDTLHGESFVGSSEGPKARRHAQNASQ